MRIWIIGVFLSVIVLAIGCIDDTITGPNPQIEFPDITKSPRPDADAEFAALVLSGALVAPDTLYERIRDDLKLIRDELADSVPAVKIAFGMPWPASYLSVKFEPTFLNDTSSNRYHQFDSLNTLLRSDTTRHSIFNYYDMRFEGRLHPARLIDMYKHVPGIIFLGAGGFVGDGPEFSILPDGDTFRYFFRDAWGDCLSGCIFSKYYYVTVAGDDVDYIGSYLRDWQDTSSAPAWIDSVKIARSIKNDQSGLSWQADHVDTLSAYFPNAVGNQWVYLLYDSLSQTFDTLTVTIVGNTIIADSMKTAIWLYDYAVRQTVDTQYVMVRDSLVLVYRRKAADMGPKEPDLDYVIPFKMGQSWKRDISTTYMVEGIDDIFLRSGRLLSWRIRRDVSTSETDYLWFYPRIGLLRMQASPTIRYGNPIPLQLISYRLFPDLVDP